MLKTHECEKKFKELRERMETIPQTEAGEEYRVHLERLRDAYGKEFRKSLCRKEPQIEMESE